MSSREGPAEDLNMVWLAGAVQAEVIGALGLGPGDEGVIDFGDSDEESD
jgi:hypothetical protein